MSTTHPSPTQKQITPDDLANINLIVGEGSRDNGLCVMTAAAWLAGQKHTDAPSCVSPVIRALLIPINDQCIDEERQRLKELAVVVLNTAPETFEVKRERAYVCADWAVRTVAPLALDAVGKHEWAAALRAIGAVVDEDSALLARDKALEAANAAASAAANRAANAAASAAASANRAYRTANAAANAANAAAAAAAARKKMWAQIMDTLVPLVKRLAAMGKEEPNEVA